MTAWLPIARIEVTPQVVFPPIEVRVAGDLDDDRDNFFALSSSLPLNTGSSSFITCCKVRAPELSK